MPEVYSFLLVKFLRLWRVFYCSCKRRIKRKIKKKTYSKCVLERWCSGNSQLSRQSPGTTACKHSSVRRRNWLVLSATFFLCFPQNPCRCWEQMASSPQLMSNQQSEMRWSLIHKTHFSPCTFPMPCNVALKWLIFLGEGGWKSIHLEWANQSPSSLSFLIVN